MRTGIAKGWSCQNLSNFANIEMDAWLIIQYWCIYVFMFKLSPVPILPMSRLFNFELTFQHVFDSFKVL